METELTSLDTATAPSFHEFEHSAWQSAVERYHGSFGRLTTLIVPALLDSVELQRGMRLLDIATGPGYVAAMAARRGAIATGMDFSPAMVAKAHALYPELVFVDGNAEALPFDDASFDAAVMSFGILHLARPELAVAEAFRVLAPGGRFAFTAWATPDQCAGFRIVLDALALGNPHVGLPPAPPFFRFADNGEARQLMIQAGFEDIDLHCHAMEWKLSAPEELFEAFHRGTARTGGLLRAQTAADLRKIRARIDEDTRRHVDGDETNIPMAAWIIAGRKPVQPS